MVRKYWQITLIAFCAASHLPAAEPEPTPSEWKLISNKEDVTLYRRTRPGSGHYESKATGEIAASSDIVRAVLDDVESYSQFMPYTVESRVIKREPDSLVGYQRISTPMIRDRDYTLRIRTTTKTGKDGTIYTSRWQTENALGPEQRPGIIRVNLCEGSWTLEPTGPNSTRATYMVYTDSGGAIPEFVKNIGSQIGIRKIFAAIRKQVRDPKYLKKANG